MLFFEDRKNGNILASGSKTNKIAVVPEEDLMGTAALETVQALNHITDQEKSGHKILNLIKMSSEMTDAGDVM